MLDLCGGFVGSYGLGIQDRISFENKVELQILTVAGSPYRLLDTALQAVLIVGQ